MELELVGHGEQADWGLLSHTLDKSEKTRNKTIIYILVLISYFKVINIIVHFEDDYFA